MNTKSVSTNVSALEILKLQNPTDKTQNTMHTSMTLSQFDRHEFARHSPASRCASSDLEANLERVSRHLADTKSISRTFPNGRGFF